MLCQLLELKALNYALLDNKNIFVNFVVQYLELIENNTIRYANAELRAINATSFRLMCADRDQNEHCFLSIFPGIVMCSYRKS
jgi:hypothetical protein